MDEKAAGGFLIRAQRIRLQSPASPTRKNRRPPPRRMLSQSEVHMSLTPINSPAPIAPLHPRTTRPGSAFSRLRECSVDIPKLVRCFTQK